MNQLTPFESMLSDLETKDVVTFVVALYGAFLSTLSFTWPRLQEWRAQRDAVFRALQGEKEAIADVAHRVAQGEMDRKLVSDRFRGRLLKALSMAFSLESSDRARAYVLAAFVYLCEKERYCNELLSHLETIERVYARYDVVVQDKEFREKRLGRLRSVIQYIKTLPANGRPDR